MHSISCVLSLLSQVVSVVKGISFTLNTFTIGQEFPPRVFSEVSPCIGAKCIPIFYSALHNMAAVHNHNYLFMCTGIVKW